MNRVSSERHRKYLQMKSLEKTENTYQEGEIVFAKTNPGLKLKIRRYVRRIYYCRVLGAPEQKEQVYFERELMAAPIMASKN
jgi:hypothetical protein